MTLWLRPGRAEDLAALRAIAEAAYAPYVERLGRPPPAMHPDFDAALAAGELTVAEIDGAAAGYIIARPRDGALFVDNVAVAPGHAGRGVGRALLEHAEAEARRRGVDRMTLYTNVVMTENQALYRRAGWRETGRHEVGGMRRIDYEKRLGTH